MGAMAAELSSAEGLLFHNDVTWMSYLTRPIVFLGFPAIWVLAVFALVHVMIDRSPVYVKHFMQVYNIVQILVCGYMVWGLLPVVSMAKFEFVTDSIEIKFPYVNFFGVNTRFDKQGEWFVFVHYLSKYLDWFDTLWIVLNKKRNQLSFLHIYHHGTIVPVWGMLLNGGVGCGTVRYGALVNSITHVIMYSHYFWTSLGFKNPFKKFITMWQITQFYSCIVHALVVFFVEKSPAQSFAWVQILYQITMVYLFSWKMSYVPKCIPTDLSALADETPITCAEFLGDVCNPQDADSYPNKVDSKCADDNKQEDGKAELMRKVKSKDRYIVIRGDAYDITNFEHPGGSHMLDLGVGRDATILFEFSHVRIDKAEVSLKALPKLTGSQITNLGIDLGPKEEWPTPSQSELYNTLRKRVKDEVLKPIGLIKNKDGVRGVPRWYYFPVIITWLICATWFVTNPSILAGICLGLSLCWIGTGVQHTANHGGLEKNTTLEYAIGLLDDIAVGGSSICWRYHHNVIHHAYCNDPDRDTDTYSSMPLLRLDSSQPWQPYHRFQWIYAPFLFSLLWISIQIEDLKQLLGNAFYTVTFNGTSSVEIVFAVLLKTIHFWWIVVLPYQVHGLWTMLFPWMACFGFGGFFLSSMFQVSHNVDETKAIQAPSNKGCWARQQISTSTSWGGKIGCFFCGGLNLQIEHHLFPCLPHHLYPQVQKIVKEECAKRQIFYAAYDTLVGNYIDHVKFLYNIGQKPKGVKVE